jgi:hypothetical protein
MSINGQDQRCLVRCINRLHDECKRIPTIRKIKFLITGGGCLRITLHDPEEIRPVAVPYGDDLLPDADLVAGDGVDMVHGDDEGAVHPDKDIVRQFGGKGFQVLQRNDRLHLGRQVDLRIVFHAFAKLDILELDPDDLVFRIGENKVVPFPPARVPLLGAVFAQHHLFDRLDHLFRGGRPGQEPEYFPRPELFAAGEAVRCKYRSMS